MVMEYASESGHGVIIMENKKDKRKKIICELLKDEFYVPMKEKELIMMLQVKKEDRIEFKRLLDELLAEGKIQITKKGKYIKADAKAEKQCIVGTFTGHPKGFGFVETEGKEQDYYVPEDKVNGAFHNDKVQAALLPSGSGKRREVEIVRILERGTLTVVGTFQKSKNFGFLIPDNGKINSDIFIPLERSKGAVDGHKAVAELTDYGGKGKIRRAGSLRS